jgi:hypothetical protein
MAEVITTNPTFRGDIPIGEGRSALCDIVPSPEAAK